MTKPFKRILFTGAAGHLGKRVRAHLHQFADIVRLSDIADFGPAEPHEEIVLCDLGDRDAVMRMCEGVDAILHFGGVSTEQAWAPIMQGNILGMVNLYEAVHKLGIRRVVFASSNHTMGMYENSQVVDATMPTRPDGYYGVSKVFGESLSRMYWDRYGIETVCLRIGYCWPEPFDHRSMCCWLSLDDLLALLHRSLVTQRVGHTITFGVSNNDSVWWDARHSTHLGYRPKDNSAQFAHVLPAEAAYPDPTDLPKRYQGGAFTAIELKYAP